MLHLSLLLSTAVLADEPFPGLGMVLVDGSPHVEEHGPPPAPFYIMESEVTQALWSKVMGTNPSEFNSCGDNCPVDRT